MSTYSFFLSLINVSLFLSFLVSVCFSLPGPAYFAGLIGKKTSPCHGSQLGVIHTTLSEGAPGAVREGNQGRSGRSDGLGPLPEAQVGQEGVFLGGGAQRGARWRRGGG